jgi:hypothetical protein
MLFLPAIPGNPYLRSAFWMPGEAREIRFQCSVRYGFGWHGIWDVSRHLPSLGVLIRINTLMNGLGTGFWLPYATVIRTGA